ncbi:unnamed protein product [Rotaria sp. Silwood2]|nr:unnamed protein product [Rotaria sp. Silwood2]CAF4472583.1 unnamed protein product [Rotaria sp. Silwood2]
MDNVVDAMGPFAGNANDPSITESILQLNDSLQRWTEYGDILLVNRGFRDCIESLEEAGFEVRMPAFLPAKQRQLPTADANASHKYWCHKSISEDCSKIICPVLLIGGFSDLYNSSIFRLINQLECPKRAILGPLGH